MNGTVYIDFDDVLCDTAKVLSELNACFPCPGWTGQE